MRVINQKPIVFENKCGCIFNEVDLAAAIVWYQDRPTYSKKVVYMFGKYPGVSIFKEKIHVHRLLMMYWERRILNTNEYVNHKNENKLDASKKNLEILSAAKHQSITNKGRKQSPTHVMKRINSTSLTRYGHIIYEHPNLIK